MVDVLVAGMCFEMVRMMIRGNRSVRVHVGTVM